MSQRSIYWIIFTLAWSLGLPLTFLIGLPEHNEGAIWEGGLFIGVGLAAFLAALTSNKSKDRMP